MHPTVEEQLQAMARVLDEVVATEEALSPGAAEAVRAIASQLRRLEASLPERLPFLRWDNAATAALLDELAGLLPAHPSGGDRGPDDLGPGDREAPTADRDGLDGDEHERNKALRARLARAVHELPDTDAGDAARARLAEHLRARLARDPALNRPRRTVTP